MRTERSRNGFTLIELLVVISIIVLLMALLLPALGSARASAQTVQCKSNLRQIYLGFATYGEDFRSYPWTSFWGDVLGNYLGSPERYNAVNLPQRPVLKCPAETPVLGPGYPEPRTMYNTDWPRCSYAMNWYVNEYNYGPPDKPRRGFPG